LDQGPKRFWRRSASERLLSGIAHRRGDEVLTALPAAGSLRSPSACSTAAPRATPAGSKGRKFTAAPYAKSGRNALARRVDLRAPSMPIVNAGNIDSQLPSTLIVAVVLVTAMVSAAPPAALDGDEDAARPELNTDECEDPRSEEGDSRACRAIGPCAHHSDGTLVH